MTGSVYFDYGLYKRGFPGEGLRGVSAVAVKTHEYTPEAMAAFDQAVLLVRDPFEALKVSLNGLSYLLCHDREHDVFLRRPSSTVAAQATCAAPTPATTPSAGRTSWSTRPDSGRTQTRPGWRPLAVVAAES